MKIVTGTTVEENGIQRISRSTNIDTLVNRT